MSTFFTEIGPTLAKDHTERWNYCGEMIEDDIPPFQAEIEEVILLCRDIETLKSPGIDKISSRICKNAFLALPDQLTALFNCSMDIPQSLESS